MNINLYFPCIFILAIMSFFFAFNNIFDFQINFQYVQDILLMNTVFEPMNHGWRNIESPWMHHLFLYFIILIELSASVFFFIGFFKRNYKFSQIGIIILLSLFLVGFLIIGSEYFLMWQSAKYSNGKSTAFYMVFLLLLIHIIGQLEIVNKKRNNF